jgi:ABC-type transport system substrate-binding protein
MSPPARAWALSAAIVLLAAACTSSGEPRQNASRSASSLPRGGTLRVGFLAWDPFGPIDPTSGFGEPYGGWQCCMLRTLYSYNGRPTDQDGSILRPDLATGPPEVSGDGTTWTFHIKPGLHYAPPLQSVEITAQDFIRAIQRIPALDNIALKSSP